MMYLHASIKLYPGKLQDFISMISEITPFMSKKHGWKLLGSYAGVISRLNTVIEFRGKCPMPTAVTAHCWAILNYRKSRHGSPRSSRTRS